MITAAAGPGAMWVAKGVVDALAAVYLLEALAPVVGGLTCPVPFEGSAVKYINNVRS